jgi:benzylsuccinate CoA-transferase BbsF subunit
VSKQVDDRAWGGVKILEFGSGAAGPIATRYFVEHGATVLRIESKSRPDFLRTMAVGPGNPHGLEGAPMYVGLNVGKRNLTLNLKQPEAVELVKRLVVEWADAVAENFARAMKGFGLDYDTLAAIKPDLVMMSSCLNGQTGPHRDYPGFGGQGSALAGFASSRAGPIASPSARSARSPTRSRPASWRQARGRSALSPAHRHAHISTCRRSNAGAGRSHPGCSTTKSTA